MGPVLHGIKKGGSSVNRISVLSYLDETYLKYPDKTAFFSEAGNMTFLHLYQYSRSAGSYLADSGYYRKPIVVFYAEIFRNDRRLSRRRQRGLLLCTDR